ncbi:MAG TPA: polyamine aminopropyltransferase [Petrotogaceae bacterium]|nr:polyamine aminopropyltransferase [Petrotogaceae bacterium]HQC40682.1 polyamine aminopropyltransferase [Petrotogaceae bacterium]
MLIDSKNFSIEYHSRSGYGTFHRIDKRIYSKQSEYQKIDIFENTSFGRIFTLDDVIMTRESDEFIYHEMLVHVPMVLHPNPEKILIIGGGDGGTSREVLKHSCVKQVTLCEIDEEVIKAAKTYLPFTSCEFDNPKLDIVIEDGAKFVKKFHDYFDIILIDSTDPTESQASQLFTEDFYLSCLEALKKDGILSAETEDPFIHKEWMRNAFKRIHSVFSNAYLYTAYIPQYAPGCWSFTLAFKTLGNTEPEKQDHEILTKTRYYNHKIHKACFALPQFINTLIE